METNTLLNKRLLVPNYGEDAKKLGLSCVSGGNSKNLVQALWKISCQFLKKLKIYLCYNSTIPILCFPPEEIKVKKRCVQKCS